MVLSKTAQSVMGGEENEQMGVGQDLVCFDVEKEYGGEEDEVLWSQSVKTALKKYRYKGRWKASGEESDWQRPGFRI